METPKDDLGTHMSRAILIGASPATAFYCWLKWVSPQENMTVRQKIHIEEKGIGGTDNFGYGEGFEIYLYRDAIKAEMDARPDRQLDQFVGDVIAHEIVHALGQRGHPPGNFIDASPMTLGTTYSNDGAKFVVEQLKLPLE